MCLHWKSATFFLLLFRWYRIVIVFVVIFRSLHLVHLVTFGLQEFRQVRWPSTVNGRALAAGFPWTVGSRLFARVRADSAKFFNILNVHLDHRFGFTSILIFRLGIEVGLRFLSDRFFACKVIKLDLLNLIIGIPVDRHFSDYRAFKLYNFWHFESKFAFLIISYLWYLPINFHIRVQYLNLWISSKSSQFL